ncbi:MAG: STAS domain-containing protein [Planctomycetota bacterium]
MPTTPGEPLRIDVTERDNTTIVTIHGDVSIDQADAFAAQLQALAPTAKPVVVLDLTEMNFICSRGLGAMVILETERRKQDGLVRLAGPTRAIRQLIEATKLHRILPIYEGVDRATAR